MVKKADSKKKRSRNPIIIIATLGVLVASGLGYWYISSKEADMQNAAQIALPDRDDILTIQGTVTLIRGSCGAKSINPNEDVRMYAVCDSGESIRIDDKTFISTSSSGAGPGFHVSTDSISLGDAVSVKYVTDKDYGPSLNCSRCSINIVK